MFLNKIRVFLLINLHIVILLTSPENLKAKELKIITGIAKVIDGDTIIINKKKFVFLELMPQNGIKNVKKFG